MGCQCLRRRKSRVINLDFELDNQKNEKEFDFIRARRLVKILLSEDYLYNNIVYFILLFNDEQFKNLFLGNTDYKNYPNISYRNFSFLLWKFEDYNSLLNEWYQDESKYDLLIKLWKSNLCISKLRENSELELKELLKKMDILISDDILIEFQEVINNSLESKASNIKNYLKEEDNYYLSLVQTYNTYEEFYKKKNNYENINITKNLNNIYNKLLEESFPLTKNYIKEKFPNLNSLAKKQIEERTIPKKFKNALYTEIINDKDANKKEISFDTISELTEVIKNSKSLFKLMDTPVINAITSLGSAFLNLVTSIKTFDEQISEYESKIKEYAKRIEQVHNNFIRHKMKIELLDLDDYEGSLKKLNYYGYLIYQDKREILKIISDLKNDENELKYDKQISTVGGIALAVTNVFISIGLGAITGGIGAFLFGMAASANIVVSGVGIGSLVKLREQLEIYETTIKAQIKYYDKIDKYLNEVFLKKTEEIKKRLIKKYAPKNITNNIK